MVQEAPGEAIEEGGSQASPRIPSTPRNGSRISADIYAQNASDFDRFKIQLAKRSRRDLVRKAYVKEKKAAA